MFEHIIEVTHRRDFRHSHLIIWYVHILPPFCIPPKAIARWGCKDSMSKIMYRKYWHIMHSCMESMSIHEKSSKLSSKFHCRRSNIPSESPLVLKGSSKLQRRRRNIPSESPLVLKGHEHISPKVIANLPPMTF